MVRRLIRHFLYPDFRIHLEIDKVRKAEILHSVKACESGHQGEIVVSVEGSLPLLGILMGRTARERANRIFLDKRVWDTEKNTGILVYLVLAERSIEIVVDRGIGNILNEAALKNLCGEFSAIAKEKGWYAALNSLLVSLQNLCIVNIPNLPGAPDKNELPELIDSH